jgi:urea transport system substrate-binding protein
MAISEKPLVDAALMAIDEINQQGGILGRQIHGIVEDYNSDPVVLRLKARKLLHKYRLNTVFGCWTSLSRKAALPIFEARNALLWYPIQYEGLEQSPNIFYTGLCLNQQIEPAVNWLLKNGYRQFYLLGSNYVFPLTANKVIKGKLRHQEGIVVGERYMDLEANQFAPVIEEIQEIQPDVVFNTLNGASNIAFYQQYQAAGITSEAIPIMAVSVAEQELQEIGAAAIGHYGCGNYFQSLDTPENHQFVTAFKQRYGADRVTSDPIQTAYSQIHLWSQAVEQAQSFEVDAVRAAAYGQRFLSPGGWVQINANHHTQQDYKIGQVVAGGQFKVLEYQDNVIEPLPWLGVENLCFSNSTVIQELLSDISQDVQYSWQLEKRVQDRTIELQEQNIRLEETLRELKKAQLQLVQTEKMSSLGQLVAGVAHEINNPVNFIYGNVLHINGYAEDLLKLVNLYAKVYPNPDPTIQNLMEEVEDLPKIVGSLRLGSERIREIVQSLKTFSRGDDTKARIVDIHGGIESTLTILNSRLKAKPEAPAIHVIRKYGQLPQVECYPGQLNQVFMNILANAIDALEEYHRQQQPSKSQSLVSQSPVSQSPVSQSAPSPSNPTSSNPAPQTQPNPHTSSPCQITIQTQLQSPDTNHPHLNQAQVVIQIIDNGPGIPKTVRDRLFDPFFTTKDVGKGTGLGLAISHQIIVERHGGNLVCISEPGKGTEFKIEIPVSQTQTNS